MSPTSKKQFADAFKTVMYWSLFLITMSAIGQAAGWLTEKIVSSLVTTTTTITEYTFWVFAGTAIGLSLYASLQVFLRTRLNRRVLKWAIVGCYGLVLLGIATLFHEAKAYELRVLGSGSTDHLYWIAVALTVSLILGHLCGAILLKLALFSTKET